MPIYANGDSTVARHPIPIVQKDFSLAGDQNLYKMSIRYGTSDWTVDTNDDRLENPDTSGTGIIVLLCGGFDNQRFTARCGFLSPAAGSQDLGICLHYLDTDRYYRLRMHDGKFRITKRDGASFTTLDEINYSFVQGTTYEFKFECIGDYLYGYLDGELKLSAADTDFRGGGFALRQYETSGFYEYLKAQGVT